MKNHKSQYDAFHIPNARHTKNSYETWGVCIISFRTRGVKCTSSQYPQH